MTPGPGLPGGPSSGAAQGGSYGGTDPQTRPARGLPSGPVGVSTEDIGSLPYRLRSAQRRIALAELDVVCHWHLLLVEVPPDCREIVASYRHVHVNLRSEQALDDAYEARRLRNV